MDNDMEDFECPDCGLKFNVIWQLDVLASTYPRQVRYCPRCGELINDDDSD